jgi:hypothetical protein
MQALSAEALPGCEADLLDALGFPDLARTIEGRVNLLGAEWRSGTARGIGLALGVVRNIVLRMLLVSRLALLLASVGMGSQCQASRLALARSDAGLVGS